VGVAIDQGVAAVADAAISFELARRADDAEIRRLLRENPMGGDVSLTFEREPDSTIAATIEGDVHHTIVARDTDCGRLVALGSVSVRDGYLNGSIARIGYLSQLRLDHRSRSRAPIVRGGYEFLREQCEMSRPLRADVYFTTIAADNIRARRFLERGIESMPTYRLVDTFITSILPGRRPYESSLVRRATPDDLPAIIGCLNGNGSRHQFSPSWTKDQLLSPTRSPGLKIDDFFIATRGARVLGCVASWDQSSFKQTVVRGYSPRLARWRPLINAFGPLFGQPRLPEPGSALPLTYLSHVAIEDDEPDIFAALLNAACRDGGRWYVLGLSSRSPLLCAIPRRLRGRTYRTNLYTVQWPGSSAPQLDGRPCQPEVALL
jgi:hypothetical protein